eukprot:SAG31_NODE_607_length_13606_cov_11.366699_13_plen_239_part_00
MNRHHASARPWLSNPAEEKQIKLTFQCKLVSRRKEDLPRRFELVVDPMTEEVSMTEATQTQFGIAGGRLLQPTKVPFVPVIGGGRPLDGPVSWQGRGIGVAPEMQVADRRLLGPADCKIGAQIDVLARIYEILSCDDTTHKFMERYPEHFPASNGSQLVRSLRTRCLGRASAMRTAAKGLDPVGGGTIVSVTDFEQFCHFFDLGLDEQGLVALGRQFADAESGRPAVRVEELIKAIAD